MAGEALDPWTTIDIGKDLSDGGMVDAVFWQEVARLGLPFIRSWSWPCDARTLDQLTLRPRLVEAYAWGEQALLVEDDLVVRLATGGEFELRVAAATREAAERTHEKIGSLFPRSTPSDMEVPITFWMLTEHGPRAVNRRIAATDWAAIGGNYTSPVRGKLDGLMEGFVPSQGGQLILWQGVPGTGKTWALRALAWEWRDWASFHYVVDPDNLFGQHAYYLVDVLLHDDEQPVHVSAVGEPRQEPPRERWRVLVLEDTGEILAADAKERTGQALSRLLNVVDGMLGQGLRVLVLVTTNEELKRLHPAVSRPGRCASRISFEPFTVEEARAWLEERQANVPHVLPRELAELYALAEGYAAEEEPVAVGFAR